MKFLKYFFFIHTFLINPLLNLFPCFWIDVFYDNMSYIGNQMGHPFYLIVWAMSSALGFYIYSKIVWRQEGYLYSPVIHGVLCAGMIVSCLIPYSISGLVLLDDLHVWMAILCMTGFIIEWVYFLYLHRPWNQWHIALLLSFLFSLFLLMAPGHITASTEMMFSFSVNIVLYGLAFLNVHGKIDA